MTDRVLMSTGAISCLRFDRVGASSGAGCLLLDFIASASSVRFCQIAGAKVSDALGYRGC
jgi:hypothetical protein